MAARQWDKWRNSDGVVYGLPGDHNVVLLPKAGGRYKVILRDYMGRTIDDGEWPNATAAKRAGRNFVSGANAAAQANGLKRLTAKDAVLLVRHWVKQNRQAATRLRPASKSTKAKRRSAPLTQESINKRRR